MRRFYFDRPSSGCIAQAVLFTDGTVVLHWLGKVTSTTIYPSLDAFKAIHVDNHPGTTIRWWDKVCFACGSTADRNDGPGFCVSCGAAWDWPVDEKNPSLGRWVPAIVINPAEEPKPDVLMPPSEVQS